VMALVTKLDCISTVHCPVRSDGNGDRERLQCDSLECIYEESAAKETEDSKKKSISEVDSDDQQTSRNEE